MIYQKIFTGGRPYHIGVGSLGKFPEHRHADYEFNYCMSGEFDVILDGHRHRVREGCVSVIPPMCAHSFPSGNCCRAVTFIVGIAVLGRRFDEFLALSSEPAVYDLRALKAEGLEDAFRALALMDRDSTAAAELAAMGDVYKLLSASFTFFAEREDAVSLTGGFSQIERIEKALEMINVRYREPLTVDEAAVQTGYGKSNFCKIFKKCMGEGFHQALNRKRTESAAALLCVSDLSVADISSEVGFSDSKSFCRVFKSVYGVTPGQYRREFERRKGI